MIEVLRRNPIIAGLGVLCAVLLTIVIFELATASGAASGTVGRKAAPAEARLLPPLAAAAPEQLYPESVNRPLWIPTRRPAPPVEATRASFARGQFILQGVTIAGDTRIAMLKEKTSGRIYRVEAGRDVNGLQVAEVLPERVTLSQGAEREVLELRVQRAAAAPGAPVSQPAPTSGPFAPSAGAGLSAPVPGSVPIPTAAPAYSSPFGPGAPHAAGGPMPSPPTAPGSSPGVVNPSATPVPQGTTAAPMTPEELLARRRARRNQSP